MTTYSIKGLRYLTIVCIVLLLVTGCSNQSDANKDSINNYDAFILAKVKQGDNSWELYKSNTDNSFIVVKNGEITSKYYEDVFALRAKLLELPEGDDIEAYNITVKKKYTSFTWESTLKESAKYVKYLYESGYELLMQANTPDYIEIYMKSADSGVKRIIITEDYLVAADVDNYTDELINKYIDINGGK